MDIVVNARFLTQKLTGVQRFAIEVSKLLRIAMPSVVFVAPANIIHQDIAQQLQVKIIGKHTGVIWEQYDLPRFLNKNRKPLLVNFCNAAPLLYHNQIATIHDMAFMVNPDWFSKNFVRFYKFLIPRIAQRAKFILTVSEFSKREILKYLSVDAQKIGVVHNSITHLPVASLAQTESYGKYVLVVGSIDKRKNIKKLIEAFKLIPDKELKLLIAGDISSIFNYGEGDLNINEQMFLLGRVSDEQLCYLYKNALMFVYPSLYEGFGIPPLEAMNYQCPTIVSDIPSLREVCGIGSLYVNPDDVNDIAEKIILLANDEFLRNQLNERASVNLKKYSWQLTTNKIIDIIKQQQ